MRYLNFLLVILLSTVAAAQQANLQIDNSKLSPKLMQLLKTTTLRQQNLHGIIYSKINDVECLSALIKVNENVDDGDIKSLGVYIGTKAGNVWTVRIPVQQMQSFIKLKGIDFIELDEPLLHEMDSARYATHVDSVHEGINLPMPVTGKGVVLGFIDQGFDYTHPAFYDTSYSHLRIKRVWDQTGSGTSPAGYSYGTEYTDTSAMLTKGCDIPMDFHATHVAGIAGGSGYGSSNNRQLRGMAYESDLVFVTNPTSVAEWRSMTIASVVDGLNYIFTYAQSVGKPAVVNLSEGSQLGPHDGSSLFCQAVDNLCGSGKLFVIAAGNDAQYNSHLKKEFSVTDTIVKTFVAGTFVNSDSVNKNNMEIWGDTTNTFCFQLSLYHDSTEVSTTQFYCLDNSIQNTYIIGSDNDTCFFEIATKTAQYNKKRYADIELHNRSQDTVCLTIKAFGGIVNTWQEYFDTTWVGYTGNYTSKGISWATDGDDHYDLGEVAATKSAITAGGYVTRSHWKNLSPFGYYYNPLNVDGDYAIFSSHGPTIDGRMKPDISAPASEIASSVNSFCPDFASGQIYYPYSVTQYHSPRNNRNYYYAVLEGTSMAAPMVSGIIALMLQVDPTLTPDSVKKVLYETAINDNFTTANPDSTIWGAGKVNAYAAVKRIIRNVGLPNAVLNTASIVIYPNPSNKSFNLRYEAVQAGLLFVEITNSLGQVVQGQPWKVGNGDNTLPLEINGAKGVYFVSIYSSGGQVVKRVIVL